MNQTVMNVGHDKHPVPLDIAKLRKARDEGKAALQEFAEHMEVIVKISQQSEVGLNVKSLVRLAEEMEKSVVTFANTLELVIWNELIGKELGKSYDGP